MPAIDPESAPEDSELMRRLAAGDDHALELLMERWKTRLTSFLLRMTNDLTVSLDLAEETFVRLYLARERYRPAGKFPTYLFTVASNLARNHFRFVRRHPAVSLDPAQDNPSSQGLEAKDPRRTPSEAAIGCEEEKEVLSAIAGLPEDQREALSLSLLDDLSVAEIAAIMGCNEKAVDNNLYRARQCLREKLQHLRA